MDAQVTNAHVLFERFNEIARRVFALRHAVDLELDDDGHESYLYFTDREGVRLCVPVDVVMDADDDGNLRGLNVTDHLQLAE